MDNVSDGPPDNKQSAQSSVQPPTSVPVWVHVASLGDQDQDVTSESDILTAMCFNSTGEYLAVGDNGGRVIVFKLVQLKNSRYFDYR